MNQPVNQPINQPINQNGPLEEIAGDWFVNRKDELEMYWQWAINTPERSMGSQALIGLRRMGKTAILHALFNRLFNEQTKVTPVYISFSRYLHRDKTIDSYEFAEEFFTGFVRSYLAFQYREPNLFDREINFQDLLAFAKQVNDLMALDWFKRYAAAMEHPFVQTRGHGLMQWVINLPKGYARRNNKPMVMMIDEFQVLTNVYNPDNKQYRKLTDSFQEAAETHWAPLLVCGSSVSMMVDEALTGLLSGRFAPWRLQPLIQEYAVEMVLRLGHYNQTPVTEELALAIWELTQGYPYPIECLMRSHCPARQQFPSLDALKQVWLFELTEEHGILREHYDGEYGKYIRRLNGEGLTRRILLWAIQQPGRRILPDQVAEQLGTTPSIVLDKLNKLQRVDVIKRLGGAYWGPADPMLCRYLEYEHAVTIAQLAPEAASKNLRQQYNQLIGEMNRKVGHLAEIIIAGVMHSFDKSVVDGASYFNTTGTVFLPKFEKLERRGGVIHEGVPIEIDLLAEWRTPPVVTDTGAVTMQRNIWLVSVRHRNEKMGEKEVRAFLDQTQLWLSQMQSEKPIDQVTRWYYSKSGFTDAAIQLLQSEGIYYNDLAQFNQLAQRFGFLPLVK